jgi:hypothetical protein
MLDMIPVQRLRIKPAKQEKNNMVAVNVLSVTNSNNLIIKKRHFCRFFLCL